MQYIVSIEYKDGSSHYIGHRATLAAAEELAAMWRLARPGAIVRISRG